MIRQLIGMNSEMQNRADVTVIGAGASGLMAAVWAARHGARTILIEQNARVGKKLLVTGNGRCNLSNQNISESNFHGNPAFAVGILSRFGLNETLNFFRESGLEIATDEAGKLFPHSLQASSVLDVLRFACCKYNIQTICNTPVESICPKSGCFQIVGKGLEGITSKTVIVSTGGNAMPSTGSDGHFINILRKLGHPVVPAQPSLVPLNLEGKLHRIMEGMKWVARVSVVSNGKESADSTGDIIFTSYGISGSAVLNVSRWAAGGCLTGLNVELALDLLPSVSPEEARGILDFRIQRLPEWTIENLFNGWINKRIGQAVSRSAGMEFSQTLASIQPEKTKILAGLLKNWRFKVTSPAGWQNAQVTAGGVDTRSINSLTLESLVCPGLFLSGEIIDVDGDSGGYNLQWAWSSGAVAGMSAALSRK